MSLLLIAGDFLYKQLLKWHNRFENNTNINDTTEALSGTTRVLLRAPVKYRVDFDKIVRNSKFVCYNHQRRGHRGICNRPDTCKFYSYTFCASHKRWGVGRSSAKPLAVGLV